jgi:hypothetical protein
MKNISFSQEWILEWDILLLNFMNWFTLIMKNMGKIFILVILSLFTFLNSFGQIGSLHSDSAKIRQKKEESGVNSKDKDSKTDPDKIKENNQNSPATQTIKQVKGARPDMSKARGARPVYIDRPAGSGIPKGIGRPGGNIKPGKK